MSKATFPRAITLVILALVFIAVIAGIWLIFRTVRLIPDAEDPLARPLLMEETAPAGLAGGFVLASTPRLSSRKSPIPFSAKRWERIVIDRVSSGQASNASVVLI